MTMQSLINIDGNGLKDVLIDLNDKLATAVGWIANKETPEKIAINTYLIIPGGLEISGNIFDDIEEY